MVPAPQALPTRFPCWCRAIYSWGGESKKDLGFVEGDLIECLNAGDGSWWTGRLRRDKRMVGLFPSNFVQVLDDSFRPTSRTVSPVPDRSLSPGLSNPLPSEERKTKPFRKPFQAYAAPGSSLQKWSNVQKEISSGLGSTSSNSVVSNNRTTRYSISRLPLPQQTSDNDSQLQSPEPSSSHQPHSRQPSFGSCREEINSSSPPAPPPHRHVYKREYFQDSQCYHDRASTPHNSTPCPPSPGPTGLTPSPLRNAMEDVISSLQDMGMSQELQSSELNPDPWSPEAFDQTYVCPSKHGKPQRPNTSMGILNQCQGHNDYDEVLYDSFNNSTCTDEQLPQLSNYVQKMQSRLRRIQQSSPQSWNDDSGNFNNMEEQPPLHSLDAVSHHGATQPPIPHVNLSEPKLRRRKSTFDVGKQILGRTYTTKSSTTSSSSGTQSITTNGSSSTQATEHSLMSGRSAGGISSTSAGSLARKKEALQNRAHSAMAVHGKDYLKFYGDTENARPETPLTGVTFHSSHVSQLPKVRSQEGWDGNIQDSSSLFGGLVAPKIKKSGFFKKIIESAKTGAASARSSIASGEAARAPAASRKAMPDGVAAIAGGLNRIHINNAAHEMGLGSTGVDWLQVRRDVNRSNSLSRIERIERRERCQMADYPVINPIEELYQTTEGNEGANGAAVSQPMNFQAVNLSLVDKNTRFINGLPPMTNPTSLATAYVCRPYRSDVQRLRAIFTWVSEKISWEDFTGDIDCKRIIQTKRGCAEEVAILVMEMCAAVGICAEIVRGYLKPPGEAPEIGLSPQSNHWWNAVLIDGEWRIMDCSLASPTNPRRSLYSSVGPQIAETWWFLTKPMEICWTHIPEHYQQQHICPPVARDILLALPCACPPFFKNSIELVDHDTSIFRIEDLELVQLKLAVPADIECVAMVEARTFQRDTDGDIFETGDVIKKRALSQAEWIGGHKHFTIKALLPGDEGHGILKIYAGKKGLMHSIKDVPHPLTLALPVIHTGENPSYEFVVRHPTPHAQRHDLYVAQPQCQRLAVNNTFVFAIRQHPSFPVSSPNPDGTSPVTIVRPSSATSITPPSVSESNPSSNGAYYTKKPAKLAIQAPGGKILRLMRKDERNTGIGQGCDIGDGGTWETIIKCGEIGIWRGLVLADRSARWCVFAEWSCV